MLAAGSGSWDDGYQVGRSKVATTGPDRTRGLAIVGERGGLVVQDLVVDLRPPVVGEQVPGDEHVVEHPPMTPVFRVYRAGRGWCAQSGRGGSAAIVGCAP